jgi:hypothetical protein
LSDSAATIPEDGLGLGFGFALIGVFFIRDANPKNAENATVQS